MSEKEKLSLAEVRRQYALGKLDESDLDVNPFSQFRKWYREAESACRFHANNMTLSTVDENGAPQSRIVLLKGVDNQGFIFFTNYQSRKAKQLANNPNVSITLFWEELERQVNISGCVEKVTQQESDEYHASRPKGSQIGAWVSQQSTEIIDRKVLEQEKDRLTLLYADKEVPRPPHWGGYRVIPHRIEFWQGQPDRLHDRLEYRLKANSWLIQRLSP